MLHVFGTPGDTCNRIRLLLQNSFQDVKLPVLVENHRYSHSLKAPSDTVLSFHEKAEYAPSQMPQTEDTFSPGPETDAAAKEFNGIIQNDILINLIR